MEWMFYDKQDDVSWAGMYIKEVFDDDMQQFQMVIGYKDKEVKMWDVTFCYILNNTVRRK